MRALLLLFALSTPALAGPDFSGDWVLDEDASQPLDAILKLQDVPWYKRAVAETLDARVTIRQSGDALTLTFDNIAGDAVQELRIGAGPHPTVNPAGMPATLTTRWDGDALVAEGPATTDDGTRGVMTERRTLSADGRTMTLQVTAELPGVGAASTVRVFRRAP